jgi:hypothetical protein
MEVHRIVKYHSSVHKESFRKALEMAKWRIQAIESAEEFQNIVRIVERKEKSMNTGAKETGVPERIE